VKEAWAVKRHFELGSQSLSEQLLGFKRERSFEQEMKKKKMQMQVTFAHHCGCVPTPQKNIMH